MANIQISINPLAEYLEASEARRKSILHEQLNPPEIKTFYYQLAKARIKKSIALSGNLEPVKNGIDELRKRNPQKKRQKSDRTNSIDALERYSTMIMPELIRHNKIEVIKVKPKFISFHGLQITVSPEIIFRVTVEGTKHIGACKLHVSKSKPFSSKQSKLVAAMLELYLSNCVVAEDEVVNPVLCFCLDTFAGTTINSNSRINFDMSTVIELCEDIKLSVLSNDNSASGAA